MSAPPPPPPSAQPPAGLPAQQQHAGGASAQQQQQQQQPQTNDSLFAKDLRLMMYGFGDSKHPLDATVSLVEDIVVEYITDLVHRAAHLARKRGARMSREDVMHVLRRDPRKYGRALHLLQTQSEQNDALRSDQKYLAQGVTRK